MGFVGSLGAGSPRPVSGCGARWRRLAGTGNRKPMKKLSIATRLFAAGAPAFVAVLLWNSTATATPEMGKKEKKECVACHTGKGLYSLNEAGKYYKQHKKMPPPEQKKK